MYDRFLTAAGPDAVAYEIRREIRAISGRLVGEKTAEFTTAGVNGHSPDETAMRNLADYSEHFDGSFVLLRSDPETELYVAENGLVRDLRPDVVYSVYPYRSGARSVVLAQKIREAGSHVVFGPAAREACDAWVEYQAKISAMTDAEWDSYLKTPRPFESRFNRAAVDLAESARRSGEQS